MGPDAMILTCRLHIGERNRNPFQYSCPENPIDKGTWRATVHGVTQSLIKLKQLSMHAHRLHIFIFIFGMWYQSLCLYQWNRNIRALLFTHPSVFVFWFFFVLNYIYVCVCVCVCVCVHLSPFNSLVIWVSQRWIKSHYLDVANREWENLLTFFHCRVSPHSLPKVFLKVIIK